MSVYVKDFLILLIEHGFIECWGLLYFFIEVFVEFILFLMF